TNAAEAIGDRSGVVALSTGCLRADRAFLSRTSPDPGLPEGDYVCVEVSDTGSGMDEATKARIFDPFFTTKFTGRGLGLAAVQGIIKAHGGAIRVHSTPGLGTSFLILLPAKRRKAAAARPEQPQGLSIPSGSAALVIEDEPVIRALASNVLSQKGMRVWAAD